MSVRERAYSLYINGRPESLPRLFAGPSSSAQGQAAAVAGDHFTLRLFWREKPTTATAATTEMTLDAGSVLVVYLRALDDLSSGSPLAKAEGFVEVTSNGLTWYEAPFNLNTSELLSAIGGQLSLACQLDIEDQNASNDRRLTAPIPFAVLAQAGQASDQDPTAANPGYPAVASLQLKQVRVGASDTDLTLNRRLDQWVALSSLTAPRIITLPASPQPGDLVELADEDGSLGGHDVQVAGNGANIDGYGGTYDFSGAWHTLRLRYTGSIWKIC
jgi:hypothetical protein